MYLGMVAVSTSYAMWRGSLLGLVPSVALACWLDQFQIPAEEDALAQKYGQAYWQYQRAVPRWIPSTERGKTHARLKVRENHSLTTGNHLVLQLLHDYY